MLPTNNDTGTFFSASSQIGKFTDFIVACHIFSLFLSISVENRLEHVTSISKSFIREAAYLGSSDSQYHNKCQQHRRDTDKNMNKDVNPPPESMSSSLPQ